jgi:hypothetical protein
MPERKLPELDRLERVLAAAPLRHVKVDTVAQVDHLGQRLPVYAIALGNPDASLPAVGCFGGVHGLERIGTRVVIAWLEGLVARLPWDLALHALLERLRLVLMPLVNPGGMVRGTRANPNGVDLMRNAPLDAVEPVPFLLGGQRASAGLPWYRGPEGAPMEAESAALCRVVQRELLGRPFSLALDCHSGFGMRDRIWFPYAHRRAPIEHLAEMHRFHEIFSAGQAHHPYVFEPQSRHYLAHGDLWDHLYRQACAMRTGVFLPLTLEMGSWLWVRKNPRQLFSRAGLFNPQIFHREQRVLRRHLPLLQFSLHAAAGAALWLPEAGQREQQRRRGLARWYAGAPA